MFKTAMQCKKLYSASLGLVTAFREFSMTIWKKIELSKFITSALMHHAAWKMIFLSKSSND